MDHIEKKVQIAAPVEHVWTALTDPATIGAWMQDDEVQVDLQAGGSYRFFGGETTGKFTQIERPNRLEYTWRQAEWKREWADSLVRWELMPAGEQTELHLFHSNFPNADEQYSHNEGWDSYFLEPLIEWLEDRD